MGASVLVATRVTGAVKARVGEVVRAEFLSESVWLRRLILRELGRLKGRHLAGEAIAVRGRCSTDRGSTARLNVRLRAEDRLLLHERAAGRGMAAGTYVSWLVRAHLRGVAPLPKEELASLKRAVAELGAVGRNLNQIARVANSGGAVSGVGREEFKGILKVCEALRDHTKALVKASRASWESGHGDYQD